MDEIIKSDLSPKKKDRFFYGTMIVTKDVYKYEMPFARPFYSYILEAYNISATVFHDGCSGIGSCLFW